MLARVMTVRFDPLVGAFDDETLRQFVKDKEVLSLREHFFAREGHPYRAVFVGEASPESEERVRCRGVRRGGGRRLVDASVFAREEPMGGQNSCGCLGEVAVQGDEAGLVLQGQPQVRRVVGREAEV